MTPKISVLCFGNSLTAGFYHFGMDYHPYAWKLEQRLKAAYPAHTIRVDVEGLPGDLVISPPGRYLQRLQRKCSEFSYDWVIMLGATNDLGHRYAPSRIFPALKESWQLALSSGAQVLALTVPECAAVDKRLNAARDELNALILNHTEEGFHAFDLHGHVPYHEATEEFRAKVWDDGLHLKPDGYDLVGNVVADHFLPLVGSDESEKAAVDGVGG